MKEVYFNVISSFFDDFININKHLEVVGPRQYNGHGLNTGQGYRQTKYVTCITYIKSLMIKFK